MGTVLSESSRPSLLIEYDVKDGDDIFVVRKPDTELLLCIVANKTNGALRAGQKCFAGDALRFPITATVHDLREEVRRRCNAHFWHKSKVRADMIDLHYGPSLMAHTPDANLTQCGIQSGDTLLLDVMCICEGCHKICEPFDNCCPAPQRQMYYFGAEHDSCFTGDGVALVLNHAGRVEPRPLSQIQVGDKVQTGVQPGSYRRVTRVWASSVKKQVEIYSFSAGCHLTSSHPI